MKSAVAVVFIIAFSFSLLAQDSSQIILPEPQPIIEAPKGPPLSDTPTAQEFAELFTCGDLGPYEAVDRAAEKGDKAVAGLTELLFFEGIRSSRPQPISGEMMPPNRVLVVLALEKIGSPDAFDALIRAATTHANPEIRAVALNIINTSYNKKMKSEKLKPQKELVDALLRNADDSTYIGYLQKPVNQIAQEGLMIWLGLDFGDPVFADERLKASKNGKEATAPECGRLWWKKNKAKTKWNKEKFAAETE
jgi:hypothetical protein